MGEKPTVKKRTRFPASFLTYRFIKALSKALMTKVRHFKENFFYDFFHETYIGTFKMGTKVFAALLGFSPNIQSFYLF